MNTMTNRLSVFMEVLLFVTHIDAAVVSICQDIVDKSSPWNSESSSHARSLQLALLLLHSLAFPFVALSITSVALSPEVFQVSLDCIFSILFSVVLSSFSLVYSY